MAEQKIFAGPRIRRIRSGLNLTQTAMAEQLGISASYLNLIERNQRPLTVQLLLKLATTFKLDLEELQGTGNENMVGQLKEAFSDPLLEGEIPDRSELIEFTEATPNVASAMVKLYRAYRESLDRLSGLSAMMAEEGTGAVRTSARLPVDEMRQNMEQRSSYIPAIEQAAERIVGQLDQGDGLFAALKNWLLKEKSIVTQIMPVEAMPDWRRRFDKHTNLLAVWSTVLGVVVLQAGEGIGSSLLGGGFYLASFLGLLAAALGGTLSALASGVPGRDRMEQIGSSLAAFGLFAAAAACLVGMRSASVEFQHATPGMDAMCFEKAALFSLLPAGIIFTFLIRGWAMKPIRASLIALIASGALGAGIVHIACGHLGPRHVLIGHLSVPLVLAVLGLYPLGVLLRRLRG